MLTATDGDSNMTSYVYDDMGNVLSQKTIDA